MTSESLQEQWARRLAVVRRIANAPTEFKECEQCRSIAPRSYGLCPFCHCYRFIEDAESLRATLKAMGQSPWPFAAAVVPRLVAAQHSQPPPVFWEMRQGKK